MKLINTMYRNCDCCGMLCDDYGIVGKKIYCFDCLEKMERSAQMNLKKIGAYCKTFREELGLYQFHVAIDTGYSKESVSSFENGRNNNATILLWYIRKGLDINKLIEELEMDE